MRPVGLELAQLAQLLLQPSLPSLLTTRAGVRTGPVLVDEIGDAMAEMPAHG